MTRGVLLLSAFTLTGSFINYVSNLLFARVMTPASYGDLTSLLSLSVVIAVPFTAAQTRVACTRPARRSRGTVRTASSTSCRHALAHLTVVAGRPR